MAAQLQAPNAGSAVCEKALDAGSKCDDSVASSFVITEEAKTKDIKKEWRCRTRRCYRLRALLLRRWHC